MVSTVRVNTDNGREFHPLADHMTKLTKFIKGGICEFSVFPFSLHCLIKH